MQTLRRWRSTLVLLLLFLLTFSSVVWLAQPTPAQSKLEVLTNQRIMSGDRDRRVQSSNTRIPAIPDPVINPAASTQTQKSSKSSKKTKKSSKKATAEKTAKPGNFVVPTIPHTPAKKPNPSPSQPPIVASPNPTGSIPTIAYPPDSTQPTRREIRGVWLTNIDSDVLFNQSLLRDAVQELSDLNFNTLYPAVWNWGYTQYPSAVAKQAIGYAVDPRVPGFQTRDMLAEMVQEGHKHGMTVIPWFEFGFMAPADSELAQRHPDWLTQRLNGSKGWQDGRFERVWLNPFKPESQQFILQLMLELVTRYGIDGIQLDDHFGLPSDFGYDPYTVELYKREHQGRTPPVKADDPEWVSWRAGKITAFMIQAFNAIKAAKPDMIISLSPNPQRFSYQHYLQDWKLWQQMGYIEELILQVYRSSLQSFAYELDQPEVRSAKSHIPVAIGVLTGLKDDPVPIARVQEQVQAARDRNFNGISFFFYETMWKLSSESPTQRKAVFRTLFAQTASRPRVARTSVPAYYAHNPSAPSVPQR